MHLIADLALVEERLAAWGEGAQVQSSNSACCNIFATSKRCNWLVLTCPTSSSRCQVQGPTYMPTPNLARAATSAALSAPSWDCRVAICSGVTLVH